MVKQLKEFQVDYIKSYIIHAKNEEEAIDKYWANDYTLEGDFSVEARDLS